MDGIKGKVVVITGASSGIGEATAVMLAERGANVVRIGSGLLKRMSTISGTSDYFFVFSRVH